MILNSCPFCKSTNIAVWNHVIKCKYIDGKFGVQYRKYTKYYARCLICNARGPLGDNRTHAIYLWNKALQRINIDDNTID